MTLERRLAEQLIEMQPGRAATVLERIGEEETIRLLKKGDVSRVGAIVLRTSPQFGADVLGGLNPERASLALETVPVDVAVRLLRHMEEPVASVLIDGLEPKRARSVRASLSFPEGSAGALMDPDVLALPQEFTVREALKRVRESAEYARYNLYVVDQDQRLVGVLNLRELLIAKGRVPLSDAMQRDPLSVSATADSATILSHPGWKEVHSLPVVDRDGAYLGAIRYRALRELEERSRARKGRDADTGTAFGELFAAAAEGLLDALGGTTGRAGGESHGA